MIQDAAVGENGRMTITEFLDARITEDEAAARAAVGSDRPGLHWQWVTNETDTPVAHGDLAEAQEYQKVSLRTVEEFPSSAGMLPAFLLGYAEEVDPGAGEHIARHDPARVLAECAAKRAIIADHAEFVEAIDALSAAIEGGLNQDPDAPWRSSILRHLASVYAAHPDYRQEWAK